MKDLPAPERGCCFTGHRTLPSLAASLLPELIYSTISSLYLRSFRDFYTGGALGFDTIAAEAVLRLREKHGDVRLHLILPCRDQCKSWKLSDIRRYKEILGSSDTFEYIADFYSPGIMQKRNAALVAKAGVCVGYVTHRGGGSYYTMNLARAAGLETINLASSLHSD